jgi:hypothetical protein
MKIFAGWKFHGRKPTHMPRTITAISGLMLLLSFGSRPWSKSRWLYRAKAPAAMATMPAASPSSPSM